MSKDFEIVEAKTVKAITDGRYRVEGFSAPNSVYVEIVPVTGPVKILSNEFDCKGINFISVEAGGGGDCFFHSVAYGLNHSDKMKGVTFLDIRKIAADAITENTVNFFLMDMAGIYLANGDEEMKTQSTKTIPTGTFDPMKLWNDTRGNIGERIRMLKTALSTNGNYFWGDANVAALLETVLNVNVVSLSANKQGTLIASRSYLGFIYDLGKLGEIPKAKREKLDMDKDTVLIMNHGNMHWTAVCTICQSDHNPTEVIRFFILPAERNGLLLDIFI